MDELADIPPYVPATIVAATLSVIADRTTGDDAATLSRLASESWSSTTAAGACEVDAEADADAECRAEAEDEDVEEASADADDAAECAAVALSAVMPAVVGVPEDELVASAPDCDADADPNALADARLLAALEADPVLVDELDDVSDDDDEAEADAELDEDDELVDEGVADDSLVPTAEADASALGLESEEADGRLVAVV
jgi:hypothetical protein